jgi:hypothetical protein
LVRKRHSETKNYREYSARKKDHVPALGHDTMMWVSYA